MYFNIKPCQTTGLFHFKGIIKSTLFRNGSGFLKLRAKKQLIERKKMWFIFTSFCFDILKAAPGTL